MLGVRIQMRIKPFKYKKHCLSLEPDQVASSDLNIHNRTERHHHSNHHPWQQHQCRLPPTTTPQTTRRNTLRKSLRCKKIIPDSQTEHGSGTAEGTACCNLGNIGQTGSGNHVEYGVQLHGGCCSSTKGCTGSA